jgi:hypothetical protein
VKYFAIMYGPDLSGRVVRLLGTDSHIHIDGRLGPRARLSDAIRYARSLHSAGRHGVTHVRIFRRVRLWDETAPASPLVAVPVDVTPIRQGSAQ